MIQVRNDFILVKDAKLFENSPFVEISKEGKELEIVQIANYL